MVVVVVVKVLVWAAVIINLVVVFGVLVIDVLVEVELIVVGIIVIILKFASPSEVDFDCFMAGVMLRVLLGIGIGVLNDVNANAVAVMTALEFPVSTPLEKFSR